MRIFFCMFSALFILNKMSWGSFSPLYYIHVKEAKKEITSVQNLFPVVSTNNTDDCITTQVVRIHLHFQFLLSNFFSYTLESVFLGFIFERFFYSSTWIVKTLSRKNWKRIFFILNWKWNSKTCEETSPSGIIPTIFFERMMTFLCC